MLIVTEISTNWMGDFEILDDMLKVCSDCGVDAVKFQALSKELIDRHPELKWYCDASVTEDNVERIDTACKQYDMEWFCTPCYPEAVDWLNEWVIKWKIRHADRNNTELIQTCFDTEKTVYISTDRVMAFNSNVKQIYCIPQYPTDYGSINFEMIKSMDGYSNHCMDPLAILKAHRMGADYIEIHITPDSSRFAIDNKVSYNFGQLEEIMKWIK